MDNPMIQIREWHDGTWSIIAKVWNPQKEFYEHPTLINLTKEEAEKWCQKQISQSLSVEHIINNWDFIGD